MTHLDEVFRTGKCIETGFPGLGGGRSENRK